jgi:hypothetical protein
MTVVAHIPEAIASRDAPETSVLNRGQAFVPSPATAARDRAIHTLFAGTVTHCLRPGGRRAQRRFHPQGAAQ